MVVGACADVRLADLRVVTDDGVALAVHDMGPPKAQRTVVFLHGLCLTHACWADQIAYLSRRYGRSVRMISYDHRGHGRSGPAPVSSYRIDRIAEDLAQVLAAAQVRGQVTLVGHSMGGMAALAYMGRPDRPVEPHGLVLIATTAGKLAERGLGRLLATPATTALPGLAEHVPDHLVRAMAGALSAALGRWRGGGRSASLTAVAVAALTSTPLSTAAGFLASLRGYDQSAVLAGVRARTVVINGGMDPLIPPAHGRELAAGIQDAKYLHLRWAGHMLPQQAPHILNDAIRWALAIEQHHPDSTDEPDRPASCREVQTA